IPALEEALELANDRTWLLMENSAGAGGTIGRSLDELVTLFEAAGAHERLGICLDTCHLYVSGVDVRDRAVVDALVDDLDARIGLDRLRALHINDAAAPLGSNRDRHANIGEGEIGEAMGVFLSHPKLQGLPAFLEVPGVDKKGPSAEELRKVREMHQRWVATAG
ncbi:MAG: deoxyribonuclease, partial [Gaiellaceae bacterium]|nr:deoxyribonuclease [Gaiellaceae bacterium]